MGYSTPTTLEAALALVSDGTGIPLAGGTDIYPAQPVPTPQNALVDLTGIPEMRGITASGGELRIGSLTTWSEIAAADLPSGCRALQQAATQIGGVQIQNVATIGGNLCNASPAADGIPPLLALDASVELVAASGRRTLRLEDFVTGYRATARRADELLMAVTVPAGAAGARSAFLKLGARRYLVISIAMVAAWLECGPEGRIEAARIAVGACGPVAARLRGLEDEIRGLMIDEVAAAVSVEHLTPLSPIDDVRASASYRIAAAATLVRRALRACGDSP